MQLASVAGVFMMAGILFPIVLVLAAVVIDSAIVAAVGLWWGWKHRHETYSHFQSFLHHAR